MFQLFQGLSDGPTRSESFADLNAELSGSARDRPISRSSLGSFVKDSESVGAAVVSSVTSKPFGLGKSASPGPTSIEQVGLHDPASQIASSRRHLPDPSSLLLSL